MFCGTCGATLGDGATSCPRCGAAAGTVVRGTPASLRGTPGHQPLGPGVAPPHPLAMVSITFSLLSWFLLPVLGAFLGIITGHLARAAIRLQPESRGGRSMATAGLILGY